ncbi:Integrase zinc binding domain [Popillia japonica]|uniref:RNA-directed DNA polymerase n=1 Tax=Popillia japonica TaxID=7064 RepID=A0AAW1HRH3_POPJA
MIVQNEFHERLMKAQREDEHLKTIMKILDSHSYEDYKVDKNILYKQKNGAKLFVVPASMRRQIIKNAHENGHFSVKKTKELIIRDYHIPSLEEKIKNVILNCIPCILADRKSGKQESILNPIEKGEVPLQIYHVDHLGPMTQTGKGYKCLFVVVDAFSKFVWLQPTKTTSTKEFLEKTPPKTVCHFEALPLPDSPADGQNNTSPSTPNVKGDDVDEETPTPGHSGSSAGVGELTDDQIMEQSITKTPT